MYNLLVYFNLNIELIESLVNENYTLTAGLIQTNSDFVSWSFVDQLTVESLYIRQFLLESSKKYCLSYFWAGKWGNEIWYQQVEYLLKKSKCVKIDTFGDELGEAC